MKKIILIGNVACGKTTICQYLNHMEIKYKKTQALEVYNTTIDTPGEYLENRGYLRSLMVTATETDQTDQQARDPISEQDHHETAVG